MCQFVSGRGGPRAALMLGFLPWLCVALVAQPLLPMRAWACGCFSPPIPPPLASAVDFAVNQQAELLIFEVESGLDPHVTAHVLIKYEGDPEKFAWLIPVPSVPELSLSHTEAFAIIDQQTRPTTRVDRRSLCPDQKWRCEVHPPPNCPVDDVDFGDGDANGFFGAPSDEFGAFGSGGVAGLDTGPPPVVVHARQDVGDYQTVTIGAGDGEAAVQWLNDEGFIVNASMGKFMQPYLDAGMLFLASKLQPTAEVDELRPLQMRYAGDSPAIPLRLTAVAAEPHLTVTALIYADGPYEPFGHPMFEVGEDALGSPDGSTTNYPSVLSRLVDEAGGDAFALEYYGPPPTYQDPNGFCCAPSGVDEAGDPVYGDLCGIGGNTACECPRAPFDYDDCGGTEGGLAAGVALVDRLASSYARVTRLTTRLSPDEMTFDPVFRPKWGPEPTVGRRSHTALHQELGACRGDLVVPGIYAEVESRQGCAGVYCGPHGECAVTEEGVGCACPGTELARVYTDLDGSQNVTCVPQQGTVDFGADGLDLPDACAGQSPSPGSECFDIGGFPTVLCPDDHAAVSTGEGIPVCAAILSRTGGPGAENYTEEVDQIEVCAPAPPSCPAHGWLVEQAVQREGVECPSSIPDPSWLIEPPPPTCEAFDTRMQDTSGVRMPPSATTEPLPGFDGGGDGDTLTCGCRAAGLSPGGGAGGGLALFGLLGLLCLRRRRRVRGA